MFSSQRFFFVHSIFLANKWIFWEVKKWWSKVNRVIVT